MSACYYIFYDDGKMVVSSAPQETKNGPIGDFFYVNNELQRAYKLVNYEGNYYFISDGHKIAKNTKVYLGSQFLTGTTLTVGYYNFDADGKMIVG